jgi:cytochrome c peroxidase
MGMQLDSVIARLQSKPYYPILFKKAFGTDSILAKNISFALAQFVRSIISFQSKYDKGRNLTSNPIADFPNFSTQENEGKKIFMTNEKVNCSGCHTTDVFILDNARNNGTKIDNPDVGTFIHTQNQQDIGRFKAPTLKNCMQRHRFMHDGNILGIDALIEHYNHGILPNPNLDNHLLDISTNSPSVMNLTPNEVNALKAFLETLTDYEIIKDEKYSNPFK